ncbi:MAG: hypothetical protein CXX81_07430 [Methanobacteriota archaeon]|nr:MAG: hypothetical protein CXX81_07430 [Euryarchaeota archaeon]
MRNHHGHHDTCPIRKIDIIGFPFARVLRSVYPDEIVPDVWSHFLVSVNRGNDRRTTTHPRQLALLQFNYEMGNSTDNDRPKAERLGENTQIAGVDGSWGGTSNNILKQFKEERNLYRKQLRDGGNTNVPVDIAVDRNSPDTYQDHEYWCTFTCWEFHDAMVEGWVKA